MKRNLLIILSVLATLFLSVNQLIFVLQKHHLFITDYERQLWKSSTSDSVFRGSYIFSTTLLLLFLVSLFLKLPANRLLRVSLRLILLASLIMSITASLWLYDMHKKHTLVGYNERLQYWREQND